MYAIIEDSGTQIKVSQGDVIQVALRDLPANAATLTFDRVLFVGGGEGAAKIGAPLVAGAKVTADVLGEGKTDKVEIFKFRRRKTYRRHRGHRQDFIKVKITGIQA
ncbi:MAG: 50S ribosomal protein L21 [Phycisphaeraceae bacterium]|nr:50S ribosomal protein L21 [Phycisphaeraceae bacterium]